MSLLDPFGGDHAFALLVVRSVCRLARWELFLLFSRGVESQREGASVTRIAGRGEANAAFNGWCWVPRCGLLSRREGRVRVGNRWAPRTCRAGSVLGKELEIASNTAGGTCGLVTVERHIAEPVAGRARKAVHMLFFCFARN